MGKAKFCINLTFLHPMWEIEKCKKISKFKYYSSNETSLKFCRSARRCFLRMKFLKQVSHVPDTKYHADMTVSHLRDSSTHT